ncbi:hypothetical protein HPB49_009967 [Dermacentor silvarum]|uniref:Uncharacterized protein n=1 Tax=Dermacentor silvarum TaxID=543639 RepID=A0ACB8CWH4_DERSI|nr:hypothetical protein HPB49_009967 [Dermacentor silvarum]
MAIVSEDTVPSVTKCIYVTEGLYGKTFEAFILNCNLSNIIDFEEKLTTIEDFERMVETIDKIKMCRGGPAKQKYPGVNPQCAYIDSLGVWRHRRCAIYGTEQCAHCKRLGGTLRCHAMRQKKRMQTSRTTVVEPTIKKPKFDVLRRRQRYLYKQSWSSRRRMRELQKELKLYKGRMSQLNQGELESILQRLPEGQRLVVEECIKLDTHISSKGRRYSDKFLTMCLLLHIRSPAAYDFLRRNDLMPLPAVSTVRKYISLVRPECGFDGKFFEAFKKRLLSKKDIQRHGMLVFDEIQVRQGREVNAKTFSYIGQVQHHDTSEPPLADHALVFMFVPFADSYTQPVGVFASKGPTKGIELAKLLLEAITLLEQAGAAVDGVVCDGASTNRSLWHYIGVSGKVDNLQCSFQHPLEEERRIFVFSDAPHLLKCIRNRLVKKRVLKVGGELIRWNDYVALFNTDNNGPGF